MKRCSGTLENKYPEWGDAAVQTACSELSGAFASFFRLARNGIQGVASIVCLPPERHSCFAQALSDPCERGSAQSKDPL